MIDEKWGLRKEETDDFIDWLMETPQEATEFLRTENGNHFFTFLCEGCGCFGELALPTDTKRFVCPENCGAGYVLWRDPHGDKPAIKCVVKPFFVEKIEQDA